MEIGSIVNEIRALFAHSMSEQRVYRLTQAWLIILRDAYHADRKQFSNEHLEFLKNVRALSAHLRRFIELQGELEGTIGLDEYNQGMQELELLKAKLAGEFEDSKGRAKLTNLVLTLEENAGPCPRNKRHRLQIRQGKNGYFWGCSAFPSCWHTQPLTLRERAQFETSSPIL